MDSQQSQSPSGPPNASLPPEVEAELRRRLAAAPAPAGSLNEFVLPDPGTASTSAAVPVPEVPPKPKLQDRIKFLGPLAPLLIFLATKLKFLLPALKFGLPALKTGGTMLISMWFYATEHGWPFAAGFVLCILVHEMGHVFAAWRLGVPVSAPIFIPFMGALILQKRAGKSAWEEALMGIGGPVAGTLAGFASLGIYALTGNPLFQAVAYVAFFLNLFNLIPIFPLDGGWIAGAISPRLWLGGIVLMGGLYLIGFLRNPLILILILLSLPRLWHGLKTGDAMMGTGLPVTPAQRWIMGISYIALCGLLLWMMMVTHRPV